MRRIPYWLMGTREEREECGMCSKQEKLNQVIAASFRSHRAKEKISQKEFAEEVEAHPSTVSSWENKGGMGLADAWKAADHYGISLDEMAGRDFVPEPAKSVA